MQQVRPLDGLEERHKWADHKELLKWINNPAGYMATDPIHTGSQSQIWINDDWLS